MGPKLPTIPEGGEIYVSALEAMGRCAGNGFGPVPLPYQEIAACAPWADERDRHVIRSMSQAYVSGLLSGRDPLAIPPIDQD